MDTHAEGASKTPDTDTRIDTNAVVTDRSTVTAKTGTPVPADNTIDISELPRLVGLESKGSADDLDEFVTTITTIAQSWCEHATDYTDIETLVCQLPIDQCTFAAHDTLAPYLGPYPMAILIRAFFIEKLNGWDETALHDYLHANPSLRRELGFEMLPSQSTFWRAWNHRFSEVLCDAVQESVGTIVRAARACDVSLPDRIETDEADDPQADDCPEHRLIAEKTDEVWKQAKPFVCAAFALNRGPNWQIHENAFWEQHAYMGMREDMYAASGPGSFVLDTTRESPVGIDPPLPDRQTFRCRDSLDAPQHDTDADCSCPPTR